MTAAVQVTDTDSGFQFKGMQARHKKTLRKELKRLAELERTRAVFGFYDQIPIERTRAVFACYDEIPMWLKIKPAKQVPAEFLCWKKKSERN